MFYIRTYTIDTMPPINVDNLMSQSGKLMMSYHQ